jgi:diacylglycerol kinase
MSAFFKSFTYAFKGIILSIKERNMKIHVGCAILSILFGFLFNITITEWFVILICIGAVLALEMINTAIEHLVDLVEPNYNPKAGAIKDLAAGAVLSVFYYFGSHWNYDIWEIYFSFTIIN